MKIANRILIIFSLLSFSIFCRGQSIHEASETGNFELVKKLIDDNPQLLNDNTGQEKRYPLHCAIRGKQNEIAKWLIKQGADVNAKDENGSSLLNYASYYGLTDIVDLLIANGVEVKNDKSGSGLTPLHMAVFGENPDVVKILIDNGIEIDDENGRAPILISSGRGNLEITKLLLDAGADPNALDVRNNNSPLHGAAASGNVELIKLLIEANADINVINSQGKSPLHLASERGHYEATKSLIESCTNINETDNEFGQTPLHASAICGSTGIIELLIRQGANVKAKDYNGNSPIYYAAKYGHKTAAGLLISAGASAENLIENFGYSKRLKNEIDEGEAIIWYLGNCGFAVKTKSKLLIFDYWNYDVDPAEPLLANGHVTPDEITGLDVYVFVSHAHYDHFDKIILEWEKSIPDIKYIFGWNEYEDKYTNFNWSRGTKIIDNLEITYIPSDLHEEGAFFVVTDGLKIYHGGDYYFSEADSGNLQFLADKYGNADIAFMECGFEYIAENSIQILNPSFMFPTHFRHNETRYKTFAEKMKNKFPNTKFICADNRGDNYSTSEL